MLSKQEQIQEDNRIRLKMQKIQNAIQEEKYRAPNPQGGQLFPEENFINYSVNQSGNLIKLQTYRYSPEKEPKAIVFMFHGLGAHINHGAHIAKELANIGCIVVGFDHRGFGKSEGMRGYLQNLEQHLQDSNLFIDKVLALYLGQNLPVFLTGLSMGGMTSFRIAIQRPDQIRGIILFAPAIKNIVSSTLLTCVKILGSICPTTQLLPVKRGMITKNPQVTEELLQDQYNYHEKMRPGTIKTITGAMTQAFEMYDQLKVPWLCIQGALDKLVDPDCAKFLHERSPAIDKQVLFYENCWHDIWHEEEILEIIPQVLDWIQKRI